MERICLLFQLSTNDILGNPSRTAAQDIFNLEDYGVYPQEDDELATVIVPQVNRDLNANMTH